MPSQWLGWIAYEGNYRLTTDLLAQVDSNNTLYLGAPANIGEFDSWDAVVGRKFVSLADWGDEMTEEQMRSLGQAALADSSAGGSPQSKKVSLVGTYSESLMDALKDALTIEQGEATAWRPTRCDFVYREELPQGWEAISGVCPFDIDEVDDDGSDDDGSDGEVSSGVDEQSDVDNGSDLEF